MDEGLETVHEMISVIGVFKVIQELDYGFLHAKIKEKKGVEAQFLT